MLIFPNHKKVLLLNPKCGSTSIRTYFLQTRRKISVHPQYPHHIHYTYPENVIHYRKQDYGHSHNTVDVHDYYEDKIPLPDYKFCFVRHPFSRIISAYKQYLAEMELDKYSLEYKEKINLLSTTEFIKDRYKTNNMINFWELGQYQYYKDCDAVYKIENGLETAFLKEGIKFEQTERHNVSKPQEVSLTQEDKEIIYNLYHREFDDLGYNPDDIDVFAHKNKLFRGFETFTKVQINDGNFHLSIKISDSHVHNLVFSEQEVYRLMNKNMKRWIGEINGRWWELQKLSNRVKLFTQSYEFHYRFTLVQWDIIRKQYATALRNNKLA